MAKTITSADVAIQFSVDILYMAGFQLQGFAADNIFDANSVDIAQTVRGADGKLSAGFIFGDITQTFHIMPDSPVYQKIQTWINSSMATKAVYRCNAVVTFPSNGKKYTCSNGAMTTGGLMPSAGKVLQPITFTVQWETIAASEYGG